MHRTVAAGGKSLLRNRELANVELANGSPISQAPDVEVTRAGVAMFEEYEFIFPDGTSRFEMLDLSSPARPQMFAFKRMHRAVAAWPLRMGEQFAGHRVRLQRRLRTNSTPGAGLP
jgi:hypothetical protein